MYSTFTVFILICFSVNQLSEVLRCAIENEAKLKCELLLPRVEFKINQVRSFVLY